MTVNVKFWITHPRNFLFALFGGYEKERFVEWFGCLAGIENSLETIFKIMSSSGNKLKGTTKAISVSASESEVTEHKRKKTQEFVPTHWAILNLKVTS